MPNKRDTRLYNPTVAAAFRRQAKLRSRPLTAQRRFLMFIVKVLEGKEDACWIGVEANERCILLSAKKTREFWDVVRAICSTIPEIRCKPTHFTHLGICLDPAPTTTE